MGHTRHRSLTTMRSYVRRAKLSQASPAGKLDFLPLVKGVERVAGR